LKGVFYHNAMDVVALAALLNHVTGLLEDPLVKGREHGCDLVALGRLFEDMGQPERAAELYECGLARDLSEEVLVTAVRRLSHLRRRQGQTVAALKLWRLAAGARQVYAHQALAKFYEHEMKEYAEALRWTEAGLLAAEAWPPSPARQRALDDLNHRRQRLTEKSKGS
jgi:tetratricopeptide (TPR) repeat protein